MPNIKPLKTLGTAIDKDKPIYPFDSGIIQAEIRRLYDSPINVQFDQPEMTFCTKVVNGIETQFFQAVQKAGVTVDKDELVKALKYDRGQYEKGFSDGMNYYRQIITESDTISRQAAIDEISKFKGYIDDDIIYRIQIALKRLSAAQPEPYIDTLQAN